MLRTNRKVVKERVRAYLKEQVEGMMEERAIVTDQPFTEYWNIIADEMRTNRKRSDYDVWQEWLAGLGGFGADIYYHGSKKGFQGGMCQDILQEWLEQEDWEVWKYSSSDSEDLMCYLCWREFLYMMDQERKAKKCSA